MEYSNANKETTMRLEANQGHRCFSSMTLPCALYLAAKVILSLRRKMLIAIVMSLALQLVQPVYAQQALQFPPTTKKTVSDELNPKGTTAIDWYVPSLDGRFAAVSLSENGSEIGSAHVYETATGKKLPDVIPGAQYPTALGSVAWNKEATGFYYTRYPQGNERPPADVGLYEQVYFQKLGTNVSEDTYVIGREFPRIAEISLSTNEDGSYLLASVANGESWEFAHYLLGPAGEWKQITQFSDQVQSVSFGFDGMLYLHSVNGAPQGKILPLP